MIRGAHNGDDVLTVRDLTVRIGEVTVLANVRFRIVDRVREGHTTGQVVAILGRSGVGKTRLLRVLAGLDAPERGTIRGIDGAPIAPGSVGMVFQDYPLLRHRTVQSNLELAGRIGDLSPKPCRARARQLLEVVKLAEYADRYPAQLSGGQRQRAAIAQQLMAPRRLLLLDEPFSGLDPAALSDVSSLIVHVANLHELNTVVLVTHDVRAALAVSDTVILLGRGADPSAGATVVGTWDLVDRGVAWGAGGGEDALVPLEREIVSRLRAA